MFRGISVLFILCGFTSKSLLATVVSGQSATTEPRIVVCFRNDDLCALSDAAHERRVMAAFDRYGIPQTVGVIPLVAADSLTNFAGSIYVTLTDNTEIVSLLQEWIVQGKVEIALHGLTHRTNAAVSVPERSELSEFRGLSLAEQKRRMAAGTAICRSALGVAPAIFIPPWNEWDANTVQACEAEGMKIISAIWHVATLPTVLAINQNCDLSQFASALAQARTASKPTLLVILYHSNTIRTTEEFDLLETVLRSVAESKDIRTATIGEVAKELPAWAQTVNLAGRNLANPTGDVAASRGAAFLYSRLLKAAGMRSALSRLYTDAAAAYHGAEYGQCVDLSSQIDAACVSLVVRARAVLVGMGFLSGMFLLALVHRVIKKAKFATLAGIGVLLLLSAAGIAVGYHALAAATRREIFVGTGLVTVGSFAGVLLLSGVTWLRRLRPLRG